MGVRLYHPATGRFLSVDPVAGGSANNYDYCNADPVNCTDLGGTFTWKGLVKGIAKVGEVASWIPGPIGAAAAGVSAVAYAASGNKGKALEMGITAAAQMVGAGAGVRAGFKVASVAAKAGKKTRIVFPSLSPGRLNSPLGAKVQAFSKKGTTTPGARGQNVSGRFYKSRDAAVQAAKAYAKKHPHSCTYRKECAAGDHVHVDKVDIKGRKVHVRHYYWRRA